MARPWDSTLYVESHYPAFSPRPKCPEYFDLGVPVVPRESAPSVVALPVAAAPVVPSVVVVVVAPTTAWSPAPLVIAPPELNPVGLSQPRL